MRNVITMALKDLLLLWRDRLGLFWIIAFPIVFALFFGFIFGGSGGGESAGMSLAVVDEDGGEDAAAFVESLGATDGVRLQTTVVVEGEEAPRPMDRETARDLVRRGKKTAYVLIPEGFTSGMTAMFTPDAPSLEVGIDPARKAEAAFLQGLMTKASFEQMATMFEDPVSMVPDVQGFIDDIAADENLPDDQKDVLTDFMSSLETFLGDVDPITEAEDNAEVADASEDGAPAFDLLQVEINDVLREGVNPPNAFAISFPQAMAWGVISAVAAFAISLVQEKTRGTDLRLRVAPVTVAHVLASKGLACFLSCAGVLVLLTAFGMLFGVRVGSPIGFAMIVSAASFCFAGLMMLVSTFGRTEQAVAGASWLAIMPMMMLGGGMIPLFVMKSWMLTASSLSPVKWMISGLEGAMWRGFTLVEMLTPCAILVGFGLLMFVIGVWVMSRRS